MINYYELLEVNEKASKEIISKVFKIHIKKNHPDLFQGEEKVKAEEKIKLINEAYEILSDDVKREDYNKKLNLEKDDGKDKIIGELKDEVNFLKQELLIKQELITNIGKEVGIIPEEQDDYQEGIYFKPQEYADNIIGKKPRENITVKDSYFQDIKRMLMKILQILLFVLLLFVGTWLIARVNIFDILFKNH